MIVRYLRSRSVGALTLRWLLNVWPPFVGAGIRVLHIAPDFMRVRVRLRLGLFNRNAFGTQFGGSLFAMTDPFYALMVLHHLGSDYIVWDRMASIEYLTPGRGNVFADFELSAQVLRDIVRATQTGERYEPRFSVQVKDAGDNLVARVERVLYVRRKREVVTTEQQI